VTLLPVGYSATGNAVMVSSGLIYVAGAGNGTNTAVLAQFNSTGTLSRLVTRNDGSDAEWNAIAISGLQCFGGWIRTQREFGYFACGVYAGR
jgi:hypothetical protein